jgi:hypothetical protein
MTDAQAKTAALVIVEVPFCPIHGNTSTHGLRVCICAINKILAESAWEEHVREQEQQMYRLYEGLYD